MNNNNKIKFHKTLLHEAISIIKTPIIIALLVTTVRYILELLGISENIIFIIGLLWLTLGFSIYWGIKLSDTKSPFILLLLCLAFFSPLSRIPVAILWWVDNKWKIGTHYGLYFNSFEQALFNQIIYGSLIQLIPGFILGSITIAIMQKQHNKKHKNG
ncbi:hypothetical protein [Tenacibaculum halocynthiae]|uniref:hypothetical protein n=1 Tax=Tenacibaculum halocynthiae TaxID=1254437 RepID=UPI003D6463AD